MTTAAPEIATVVMLVVVVTKPWRVVMTAAVATARIYAAVDGAVQTSAFAVTGRAVLATSAALKGGVAPTVLIAVTRELGAAPLGRSVVDWVAAQRDINVATKNPLTQNQMKYAALRQRYVAVEHVVHMKPHAKNTTENWSACLKKDGTQSCPSRTSAPSLQMELKHLNTGSRMKEDGIPPRSRKLTENR